MKPDEINLLAQIARKRNYGRGKEHAEQVKKLSLKIYDDLLDLGVVEHGDSDKQILGIAALLHDIGLPEEPHNEIAFATLSEQIRNQFGVQALSDDEISTILYCVLWHRSTNFSEKATVPLTNPAYVKKMAAIVRVADALDRSLRQYVEDVNIRRQGRVLKFQIASRFPINIEKRRAEEKANLFCDAYNVEVSFTVKRI